MDLSVNTGFERSDRRTFLRSVVASVLGGTAYGLRPDEARASGPDDSPQISATRKLPTGAVILFQGDSITDAGRDREATEPNGGRGLGPGYAFLAASRLLRAHPQKELACYNRGISGNKVFQLAERWERDCLSLEPDVLSILVGVNDYWHTLTADYEGTVETYESDFRALLDRTREALPETRLILGEPYALPAGNAVDQSWFPAFGEYQDAARRIAEDYDAAWVPFQSVFEEASEVVSPAYWAPDGVHPSPAGAALMAEAWLQTFRGTDQ